MTKMILTKKWERVDCDSTGSERRILQAWGIKVSLNEALKREKQQRTSQSLDRWLPPLEDLSKLNFHGFSKDNPVPTDYEFIIRDQWGAMRESGYVFLLLKNNNTVEIEGLLQGLGWVLENNSLSVLVEGDSQILINMEKKLQSGTKSVKAVGSWRLEGCLEIPGNLLMNGLAARFSHVRRNGNKFAGRFENLCFDACRTLREVDWDMIPNLMEEDNCRVLAAQDIENI